MDNTLHKIIKQSSFTRIEGTFIYTKVKHVPPSKHFLISHDDDEITVVTTADKLNQLEIIERNKEDYTLISLNVSVPFYCVGFLAAVSDAIAKEGMNILIVSTYSKDYILVKESVFNKAREVLLTLGFQEK